MDVIERIDALLGERHLLTHSFYTKWTDGTLPLSALQDYACQYFRFESSFPRFLSALHSRSDQPGVRRALLENLVDEERGDDNHAELWLRFAECIGVSREDVAGARPNASTEALVETYRRVTSSGPIAAGVAALYAYERQFPEVAAAKADGLARHFGVTDGPGLAFFEVHRSVDVAHAAAEREVIEGADEDERAEVVASADAAISAWWSFLDAVDPAA